MKILGEDFETFEEWLYLIKQDEIVYPRFKIPLDWLEDYIEKIDNRSETEAIELIRYLLFPFTRGLDLSDYETFVMYNSDDNPMIKVINKESKQIKNNLNKIEKYKRIQNGQDAWEGLTWILQFLPHSPYKAIKALNIYLNAEICYMPDDRIEGIEQCIKIIESKFIHANKGLENYILNLKPREFEFLIGSLYQHLGYDVYVTPSTRDNGKDVVAKIKREDGKDVVYVECKLYKTTELSKETVKSFGYTIIEENANRGVLFCTGYVNENIKKMNSRIQICTLEEMIILFNAHFGSNWYTKIDTLIKYQKYKQMIGVE